MIAELIAHRWSPKDFTPDPISEDQLRDVFEAGRWAASSYNEQPWRFVYATQQNREQFNKILSLLVPGNAAWAKNAFLLVITAARKNFSHNETPNRYAMHDLGQATANMMLQAHELGLAAHAMGGFDYERARTELKIPDDYEVGAAIAFGHLAPDVAAKDRTRKPLSDIAFVGSF